LYTSVNTMVGFSVKKNSVKHIDSSGTYSSSFTSSSFAFSSFSSSSFISFIFTILFAASVLFLLSTIVLATIPSVSAASFVVVDSRDWHDLYLGSVYAGLTNQSVISFGSLGEAQVQSKLIPPDSQVIILEPSKNPVVKKYASYLAANGVSTTNTLNYDGYIDLQFKLLNLLEITPNQAINGYAVIYAPFGVEAVTISPLLMKAYFMPLFVDETTANDFFSALTAVKKRPTILAGHMPVRLVSDLQNAMDVRQSYVGEMENNTAQINHDLNDPSLSGKAIGNIAGSKMGIISRIDYIDLQSLKRGLPQFVFAGTTKTVADEIANTNIMIFEVISSQMTDIAKTISAQSGKNLKLLVKYARGFTNIQGLSGQLLDLDTVSFPYPFAKVSVVKAIYYPQESTIGVTFTNSGNVPAITYSTIEFGQSTYSDDDRVIIPPQTTLTVPYKIDAASSETPSSSQVVVNTLYGRFEPLTQSIVSSDGQPLVVLSATTDQTSDSSNISFVDSRIDETNGILELDMKNNAQVQAIISAQVVVGNITVVSSLPKTLSAEQSGRIDIPIPYQTAQDLVNKPMKLIFSYGEKDTIKQQAVDIQVTQVVYEKRQTSHFPTLIVVVIIVIILLVILIIYLRKTRKNQTHKVA